MYVVILADREAAVNQRTGNEQSGHNSGYPKSDKRRGCVYRLQGKQAMECGGEEKAGQGSGWQLIWDSWERQL